MNTQEDTLKLMEAFIEAADTKSIGEDLVKAFEALVLSFIDLKASAEADRKMQASLFRDALQEMRAKIATLKDGDPGKTPIAGIDYPSKEQIARVMEAMRPRTPQQGVDYFIPTIEEIVSECMKMMDSGEMTRMLFAVPENVVSAINGADNQIKPERIEGLKELIEQVKKKVVTHFYAGAPSQTPQSASVSAWNTPVESPNGIITAFTVSGTPVDVVADGISMYSGAGYTFSGGQITFTNPPSQYVRYR